MTARERTLAAKRSPTTKSVSLLKQLYDEGQLQLAPPFQRNAVWPPAAKAYLIDTILHDQPVPLFFLQRTASAQSGRTGYTVIDGQQRLRAIFDFIDGRFRLTQSKRAAHKGRRFEKLTSADREHILNYDLIVEELSGYGLADIKDMFIRINRFVVKLSPQELRHAREDPHGKFAAFVERIGKLDFWRSQGVFTTTQIKRMVPVEFAAELAILLIEGPQDKKESIDLYYGQFRKAFPLAQSVEARLGNYLSWISRAVPKLADTRFRKPVDLYALIGAVDRLAEMHPISRTDPKRAGKALIAFDKATRAVEPDLTTARYLAAASRQTDNIAPRLTRIRTLEAVIRDAI
jgi:hypothetical protein